MIIIHPEKWGDGWGMDTACNPYRLTDGVWVEQPAVGETLKNPKKYLEKDVKVVGGKRQ